MNTFITVSISVISAVIGGIIAGYFSLRATNQSHANQKEIAEQNELQVIKSLLQAIHDELETVFENYQASMGNRIESLQDGQPLFWYYPLVSDFFNVYNGNTFLIGRIKDHDLRKNIIKTYTLGKGMIDSYRMNNDLVQKTERWNFVYTETQQQIHLDRLCAQQQGLIEYARTLKTQHYELKEHVNLTLRALRKSGVLTEAK
ncbi:hypothetical protein [Enterobacter kobei]|uniref:hypothetical protein n=1 Tax=Enterobacter kobei TaxID=208224 RepID=UPI0020763437|nr:hypothetical protein [Enterobacter kobei]MCM7502925.1 hypothetical protein [Enterobacter kobei]